MFVISELGLAREGLVAEAADSARRQVELAYARGDDQAVLPIVAAAAWTLARAGRADEASSLLDDLLDRRRANPHGFMPGYWTLLASLALERIGRSGALASLDEPAGSRLLEAALADRLGPVRRRCGGAPRDRAPQLEAESRVLAARERDAAGDATGAEHELTRAREPPGPRRDGAPPRADAETEATSRSGGT